MGESEDIVKVEKREGKSVDRKKEWNGQVVKVGRAVEKSSTETRYC